LEGVLLLLSRAPAIRPASRKSHKAAPALPFVRSTDCHTRVCSAVRRAGESIDAQLAAHGISWLLLHSPSCPNHPVGLRVGWSSGPLSHEGDSTPKVAPAGGLAGGRAADLRNTLCSNAVPASSGTRKIRAPVPPPLRFQPLPAASAASAAYMCTARRISNERYIFRDLPHLGVDPVS